LRGVQPAPHPKTAGAERVKPPTEPSAAWPSRAERKLE
jgi:hypothetical protein